MRLPFDLMSEDMNISNRDGFEMSPQHVKLEERLKKTLYFGKLPSTDRPSLPLTDITVEFFQDATSRELGKIDVSYASSVSRRACISPYAMMIGMIYAKRLKNKNSDYLDNLTSSDLFLMCMMMASKFHYDEGVDEEVFNDEWAESAHMDVDDLNDLEREFLAAIDWHLFVDANDFASVLRNIENRIALSQGIDRGWFSYTDLDVLTHGHLPREILTIVTDKFCKVIVVCSVAYLAGVLTMVLSTILVSCLQGHMITGTRTLRAHVDPINQSQPSIVTDLGAAEDKLDVLSPSTIQPELLLDHDENAFISHPSVLSSLPSLTKLTLAMDLIAHFFQGVALNFGATGKLTGCLDKRKFCRSIINDSDHGHLQTSNRSTQLTHGSSDIGDRNSLRQRKSNKSHVNSLNGSLDGGDNAIRSSWCFASDESNLNQIVASAKSLRSSLGYSGNNCCGSDLHLERNRKPFIDVALGFETSSYVSIVGA